MTNTIKGQRPTHGAAEGKGCALCRSEGLRYQVATDPGKCRALPDPADGRLLDLIEEALAGTASAQPWGVQKIQPTGMAKNRCNGHLLAALTNRWLARHQLMAMTRTGE